jgi:hypothetical protein
MKRQILITILIVFSFQLFGQNKSINFDTLSIEVNEGIRVRISSYENGWLMYQDGLHTRIDSLKADLVKIQSQLPSNCNLKLTSKQYGEIIVEQIGDIKNYQISDKISFTRQNEICIYSNYYDILIYFRELNDFLTSDIQECVNKVIDWEGKHLREGGWVDYEKGKFHGIAWTMNYKCENDTIIMIPEKSHYNANKSQLSIKTGIGVGLIQNQLSPDIIFKIGKFNTRKGILKHHIYLSDNLNYIFAENNSIQIQNFINLGYRFNLSNSLKSYNWIGLEIGYLTKSKGDLFREPTFRIGTMIDLRYNITLSPQLYIDDGFKNVYPAIRIGIDIGL